MKIFNTLHYWIDSYRANYVKTKIERFQLDQETKEILVIYRVGNKRLLNKLPVMKFEHDHFDHCANFDQHRLTKFSTLQNVLQNIGINESHCQMKIMELIDNEAKHEQLF